MNGLKLAICLSLSQLVGCTLGPDYRRPEIIAPTAWRNARPTVDDAGAAELANVAWWERFNDDALDGLIKLALKENKDLLVAKLRIEEYDAKVQSVSAAGGPQLAFGSPISRQRLSQERPVPLPPDTLIYNNSFEVSASLSWELDIWGRIRRSNEAALAELLSAEEAQRALLMTLVSDVATGYIQLLFLDSELQILRRSLASSMESLAIFTAKVEGGSASQLQLAQVRAAYEQAASLIPGKERDITQQENALSLLIGSGPGPIRRGSTLESLVVPAVPQGIPSQVLERRPDVRKAEQDLIAANARIGVAKTEYFPTISLTGNFGYSSTDLSKIGQRTANFGLFGNNLLGPLFTSGRIEGNVAQTEAIQKEMVQVYLRAILTAFREVDDALIYNQKSSEQFVIQGRQVDALKEYATLMRKRYEGGYSNLLDVLGAERTLYAGELSRVQTQRDVYSALVAVYKSMGGGWIVEAEKISGTVRLSEERMKPAPLRNNDEAAMK